MSKLDRGAGHRIHQRRMYGVLAILAGVLTLAAIWNMPSDHGQRQWSPVM
jgi:hypothetical protein